MLIDRLWILYIGQSMVNASTEVALDLKGPYSYSMLLQHFVNLAQVS